MRALVPDKRPESCQHSAQSWYLRDGTIGCEDCDDTPPPAPFVRFEARAHTVPSEVHGRIALRSGTIMVEADPVTITCEGESVEAHVKLSFDYGKGANALSVEASAVPRAVRGILFVGDEKIGRDVQIGTLKIGANDYVLSMAWQTGAQKADDVFSFSVLTTITTDDIFAFLEDCKRKGIKSA